MNKNIYVKLTQFKKFPNILASPMSAKFIGIGIFLSQMKKETLGEYNEQMNTTATRKEKQATKKLYKV